MASVLENYQSHRFQSCSISCPTEPEDFSVYCEDCGMEDRGNPDEFPELNYPPCPIFQDEDRRQIRIASIGASSEVSYLISVIERLTGERLTADDE